MKKLLLFAGIVIAIVYFPDTSNEPVSPLPQEISYSNSSTSQVSSDADQMLLAAFEQRRSGYQVQGGAEVIRLLSDDNEGSRHQRFIVRLSTGQTMLVAHNIDLAARIGSLKVGDNVEFNGEYEWNAEGGVIHWTHHDPQGSHVAGWLKHNGQSYQ